MKGLDQKALDDYSDSEDYYMPEFGRLGKKTLKSKYGGPINYEEWREASDKIDLSDEEIPMKAWRKQVNEEVNKLKGEIRELRNERESMKKFEVNLHAFDELFEIFDTTPPKIKDKKEFEKWVEEGE